MRLSVPKERLPIVATAAVFVTLYTVAGSRFPGFLSPQVFVNLLSDNAFLGIVAMGMTFVVLSGGIDLSVGSMVGCTSILLASLVERGHWTPGAALAAVLAFGTTVGAVQGLLVQRYSLPPFLVTLAGLFFCRGVALSVSRESIQVKEPVLRTWSNWSASLPGGTTVPLVTLLLVAVAALSLFVSTRTTFGRTVCAMGGNEQSARLMGLRVDRTKVAIYTLSGALSALGGVAFTLYTSSGNAVSGTGLELDAIAAVVVGGTLLTGGYGSVLGSFLGVLTLGLIQTAITFDGTLSSWWTKIATGALLLVFVLLQRFLSAHAWSRVSATADP